MAMVLFTKIQHPMQNYPYSPYTITHKLHNRQKTKIRSHETAARALFSTRTCQNPMINERKTLQFFPRTTIIITTNHFFLLHIADSSPTERKVVFSLFVLESVFLYQQRRDMLPDCCRRCIIVLSRGGQPTMSWLERGACRGR